MIVKETLEDSQSFHVEQWWAGCELAQWMRSVEVPDVHEDPLRKHSNLTFLDT